MLVKENEYEDLEDEDEESGSDDENKKPPPGSAYSSRATSDMRPTSGRSTAHTARSRTLSRPVSTNKLNGQSVNTHFIYIQ